MSTSKLRQIIRLIEENNGYQNMLFQEKRKHVIAAITTLHKQLQSHFLPLDPNVFFEPNAEFVQNASIWNGWQELLVGYIAGGEAVPSVYINISLGNQEGEEPSFELRFKTVSKSGHRSISYQKFYLQPDGSFGTENAQNRIKNFPKDEYRQMEMEDIEAIVLEMWAQGFPKQEISISDIASAFR